VGLVPAGGGDQAQAIVIGGVIEPGVDGPRPYQTGRPAAAAGAGSRAWCGLHSASTTLDVVGSRGSHRARNADSGAMARTSPSSNSSSTSSASAAPSSAACSARTSASSTRVSAPPASSHSRSTSVQPKPA
jgi:hypothetical protein